MIFRSLGLYTDLFSIQPTCNDSMGWLSMQLSADSYRQQTRYSSSSAIYHCSMPCSCSVLSLLTQHNTLWLAIRLRSGLPPFSGNHHTNATQCSSLCAVQWSAVSALCVWRPQQLRFACCSTAGHCTFCTHAREPPSFSTPGQTFTLSAEIKANCNLPVSSRFASSYYNNQSQPLRCASRYFYDKF